MTTADTPIVRLRSNELCVVVDPERGGRVAQIDAFEVPLLVGRDDAAATSISWGAFPMVPWAGRIRNGQFTFDGADVQLVRNLGPHAIHGLGYINPWAVERVTATSAELSLQLPTDERWPYGGVAHQRITVSGAAMTSTLSITAADRALPASLGWHPWFRKPSTVEFHPDAMYRRDDDHIALDELVDAPDGPWDDCFVNRAPVVLVIDGVEIELTSACSHWVVYDEPPHATCVEPQTGPPDAFNIAPHVVEPGSTFAASYQLSVRKR